MPGEWSYDPRHEYPWRRADGFGVKACASLVSRHDNDMDSYQTVYYDSAGVRVAVLTFDAKGNLVL